MNKTFDVGRLLNEVFTRSGEEYINIVSELANQHDMHYRAINFGEDIIKSMIMTSIYGMPLSEKDTMYSYKLMIQRVERIAKHYPDFTGLPYEVQDNLLKHNADMIVSLRWSLFFHINNGIDQIISFCGKEDFKVAKNLIKSTLQTNNVKESDYKIIPYEKMGHTQKLSETYTGTSKENYYQILSRVGSAVSFNLNLVKLLTYLVLFCTGLGDTELDVLGGSLIKKAQDRLIHITQKYVFSTYPETMAGSVFDGMMKCIELLKQIRLMKNQDERARKISPNNVVGSIRSVPRDVTGLE